MSHLVAIDAGMKLTGYAIFDMDKITTHPDWEPGVHPWARCANGLIDCGTVKGSSSRRLPARLMAIVGGLRLMIDAHPAILAPDYLEAVVEIPAWAGTYGKKRSNPKSVAGVHMLVGAVLVGLLCDQVHVREARKVTKGHRRLVAQDALLESRCDYVVDPNAPADVWDAIYLGLDWLEENLPKRRGNDATQKEEEGRERDEA